MSKAANEKEPKSLGYQETERLHHPVFNFKWRHWHDGTCVAKTGRPKWLKFPRLDMLCTSGFSCLLTVDVMEQTQIFNVRFVNEVEKYPVLYNYKSKEYSKRDVV